MAMTVTLKVWRQAGPTATGRFETYTTNHAHPDMSFLEMLDVVNEELIKKGKDPIAFDSDCREGICGSCGLVIDGAGRTARTVAPPPARCTCAASRAATRSPSSRSAPRRSR